MNIGTWWTYFYNENRKYLITLRICSQFKILHLYILQWLQKQLLLVPTLSLFSDCCELPLFLLDWLIFYQLWTIDWCLSYSLPTFNHTIDWCLSHSLPTCKLTYHLRNRIKYTPLSAFIHYLSVFVSTEFGLRSPFKLYLSLYCIYFTVFVFIFLWCLYVRCCTVMCSLLPMWC